MEAGISTLGMKLSYGIETVKGQKPAAFTVLHRINSIGGVTIEASNIDASAMEDLIDRYAPGRGQSPGNIAVSVNTTNETNAEWKEVITQYKAVMESGKRVWWQVTSPYLEEAYFIVAAPPLVLPMSPMEQNSLLVNEIPLTIDEYIGLDTKVQATDSEETA